MIRIPRGLTHFGISDPDLNMCQGSISHLYNFKTVDIFCYAVIIFLFQLGRFVRPLWVSKSNKVFAEDVRQYGQEIGKAIPAEPQ